MAQDTASILKELSSLSNNLDSLARELKEQNKISAETNKNTNQLVNELKQENKSGSQNSTEEKEDPKKFEKMVGSFSKELEKTLGKQAEKNSKTANSNKSDGVGSKSNVSDLLKEMKESIAKNQTKPAEVKPNIPNLDLTKILGLGNLGLDKLGLDKLGLDKLGLGNLGLDKLGLDKLGLDKLPKLKDGGQIEKDGMAIVGEAGPEIVKLKKDQKVINQDELYKSALEEMEEDRKRRANPEKQDLSVVAPQQRLADIKKTKQKEINTAKSQINEVSSEKNSNFLQDIVTQMPTLEGFIENKFGVKVPKAAIQKEREDLLKSDLDYYTKYPEDLQEDLDYFIESYNEAPEPTETQPISVLSSLTQKEQGQKIPTQKEQGQKIPGLTDGMKPETDSKIKSKKENKKNQESVISPTKPKLLESLKAKGKEFGSKFKENLTKGIKDYQQSLSQKTPESGDPTMDYFSKQAGNLVEKLDSSKLNKETPTLKKSDEKSPSASSPQQAEPSPSTSTPDKVENTPPQAPTKTNKTPKGTKEGETLSSSDIKEIKGLLAGIYKSLSGPLRIANDTPFRPSSNII